MARALPTMRPNSVDLTSAALNSSGRGVTRRYLRMQLRELDAQIEALLYAQTDAAWRALERAAWSEPAAAKVMWTGRLELLYLQSVRDTLAETLTRL